MGKRKFHDEAKYAPRRAHLLEVGVRLDSSTVQCSIDGDVRSRKGVDHWEVSNNPENTSTSSASSPASSASDPCNASETENKDEDPDDLIEMNGDEGDEGILGQENDPDIAEDSSPTSHKNSTSLLESGPNVHMGIDLLHLCTESQVPLHFYDKVLRIFKQYSVDGSDTKRSWCNNIPSRENLLKQIKSKIGLVKPVFCPLDSTDDIVAKFPFRKQLLDLFSSRYFEDINCCCVAIWNVQSKRGRRLI